jgi:hypothetical protein
LRSSITYGPKSFFRTPCSKNWKTTVCAKKTRRDFRNRKSRLVFFAHDCGFVHSRTLLCVSNSTSVGQHRRASRTMGAGASASKKPTSATEVIETESNWLIAQVPECVAAPASARIKASIARPSDAGHARTAHHHLRLTSRVRTEISA